MPAISIENFKKQRTTLNDTFRNHRVPQMDYLESVFRSAIATLNGQTPKDTERIKQFTDMASAIHTTAHSGRMTLNSTLENALNTLGRLPELLEAGDGSNLKLLRDTADKHPELKNGLHAEDMEKDLIGHLSNVSGFCDITYKDQNYMQTLENRIRSERRERFYQKIDGGDYGVKFRDTGARQINFMAHLLEAASEDARRDGDTKLANDLEWSGKILDTLGKRAYMYNDANVIENRLDSARLIPGILEGVNKDGVVIRQLRRTLKAHPELKDYLPKVSPYEKKTLTDHIEDVGNILEMNFSPDFKKELAVQKIELQDEAKQEAEEEARRQEEYEQKVHAETIAKIRAEEKQEEEEDAAAKQSAENQRLQAQAQRNEAINKQQQFREQNGAFRLPPEYDNRDAAGMFVDSAKQRGEQFIALSRFNNQVGKAIDEWNQYGAEEYNKRLPKAMEDLPEEPTDEQRDKAIDDALKAVPAEEREQHLRSYYTDNYDAKLAEERSKLGEQATDEQASINLYKEAVAEQYRDELRRNTYTSEKIKETQQEAAIELSRSRLNNAGQEEKQKFEEEKVKKTDDIIARQIKGQIIEAFRGKQEEFLDRHFPVSRDFNRIGPAGRAEREFIAKYPRNQELHSDDRNVVKKALYEAKMEELVDIALYDETQWDRLNDQLKTYGNPESLADPEGQKGPLDVALQKAQEAPNTALAEKELLLERAKEIPQQQIDKLAEEKLPLPKTDQQLLYGWARDQKKERLQEEIKRERDEKFPEIKKTGIDNLKEMQKQSQTILKTCREVLPQEGENDPAVIDYEKEIKDDPNVDRDKYKTLKAEYRNSLKEAEVEKARRLYPKLMTDADKALKEKMEQDAVKRQDMSEKEKREADLKALTEQRDAAKKKRMFEKDIQARQNKADEEKRTNIDNVKNSKVKGKLEELGDAMADLCGKLSNAELTEGELGKAYKDLDKAFTKGDFEKGKGLKNKLGVEPEKRPAAQENNIDPNVLNGLRPNANNPQVININAVDEENNDEISSENGDDLNASVYTEVDDGILYSEISEHEKQLNAQQKEIIEQPEVKPEEKKLYIFSKEYKDAKKKKEIEAVEEEAVPEDNYSELDMGDPVEEAADTFLNQIPTLWNSTRNDRGINKEGKQWRLSSILAIDSLVRKAKKTGDRDLLSFDNIEEESDRIRKSVAFKKLFEKGSPNYLAEQNADKLIKDYRENVKKISAYRLPLDQQVKLSGRIAPLTEAMRNTYSGKIARWVPRGPLGNSQKYKDALAAMRTVENKKATLAEIGENKGILSADETYSSVQTVLNYLDGKENVRKREFGRIRWNQCMTFLKYNMPPEEFKKYCDHVNRERGVADDPASEKYVSPESFGSTAYSEACEEALDQIQRCKKDDPENYATLLALRNMDPLQPVNKSTLTAEKERILSDPNFQYLASEKNFEHLKAYVITNGGKDYTAHANAVRNHEEHQKDQNQPVIQ